MNHIAKYSIALISVLVAFSSCKKDEPLVSAIPKVEFISISPAEVKEYKDEIVIKIAYLDGDGDLGENNPNVSNLFVVDLRDTITYEFRIQQLSPEGADIAIRGNLNVILSNSAITDGSASQTVNYALFVKDRAGNMSNIVFSTPINVTK